MTFLCRRHIKLSTARQSYQWTGDELGMSGTCQVRNTRHGRSVSTYGLYSFVAAFAVACYLNSLDGDFVHDDIVAVTTNSDVLGKTTLAQLFCNDFWGKPMAEPTSHKSYRPLTVITFRLNMAIAGGTARSFHLTNVFLHAGVVLMLMQLCEEVLAWRREAVATTALLFASHPIHTEAVSNIVGRAEILCCIIYLASLVAYTRQSTGGLAIAMLCATLALLAKEQGVTVLAVCFSYQLVLMAEQNATRVPRLKNRSSVISIAFTVCTNGRTMAIIITMVALIFFRSWMLHGTLPQFSEQDNPAAFSPLMLSRFLTYSYLTAFNAWLLLAPITLSYDWQMGSIPLLHTIWDHRNLSTLLLGLVLAALSWHLVCGSQGLEKRTVVLSLSLIIFPFLPASNIFVTVGFVVAERVLYIPSVGFCILVSHGLQRLMQRGPLVAWACRVATGFLVILFVLKTVTRNTVWSSRESLFKSGLSSVPANAKVHYNYANLRKDQGDTEAAIGHYRIALSLWPEHASAHNNLGTLIDDMNIAEHHFRTAVKINPCHANAHFNLANIYSKRGKVDIAEKLLRRAIDLDPDFIGAYSALAAVYADTMLSSRRGSPTRDGRPVLTRERSLPQTTRSPYQKDRSLSTQEGPQIMDNLGMLFINAGRKSEAKQLYKHLHRKYPDYNESKVHYAQLLIQERNFNEAESLLLAVISSNSSNREALHVLGSLYGQVNRTAEALEYIIRALSLCYAGDESCGRLHADHGDILKDLNDFESAEQSYHLALMLDPELAHAHLNLAVIYHIRGNLTAAKRHYEEAYNLDSSHALLLDNMRKLRHSLLNLPGGKCWRPDPSCSLE